MAFQKQRRPGNGRVWPPRQQSNNPNAPQFSGSITLPDGHEMRVSMWEQFDRNTGAFTGFSLKLSEDTRQGNPTQAQAPQRGYQPQSRPQGNNPPPQQRSAPQGNPGPSEYDDSVPPPGGEDDYGYR